MNDGENPYRAPEAAIDGQRELVRRPPVYTAISLFCWVIGGFHFVGSIAFVIALIQRGIRLSGKQRLVLATNPRILLLLILPVLATLAYFAAAWLLWGSRGRPGLILSVAAMFMTYLAVWLVTWR